MSFRQYHRVIIYPSSLPPINLTPCNPHLDMVILREETRQKQAICQIPDSIEGFYPKTPVINLKHLKQFHEIRAFQNGGVTHSQISIETK